MKMKLTTTRLTATSETLVRTHREGSRTFDRVRYERRLTIPTGTDAAGSICRHLRIEVWDLTYSDGTQLREWRLTAALRSGDRHIVSVRQEYR